MAPKFEMFLVKMAAVEALQDPFFHMYSSGSDEDNFKSLDPSGVNRVMMRQFKRNCKSYLASQILQESGNGSDASTDVVRKNPGFDPVFMKV